MTLRLVWSKPIVGRTTEHDDQEAGEALRESSGRADDRDARDHSLTLPISLAERRESRARKLSMERHPSQR